MKANQKKDTHWQNALVQKRAGCFLLRKFVEFTFVPLVGVAWPFSDNNWRQAHVSENMFFYILLLKKILRGGVPVK